MTTAKKQECENFKILVESLKPEESIQIMATRGGAGSVTARSSFVAPGPAKRVYKNPR